MENAAESVSGDLNGAIRSMLRLIRIATFKSFEFGTVAAIAVEIHVWNFDMSGATTNKNARHGEQP